MTILLLNGQNRAWTQDEETQLYGLDDATPGVDVILHEDHVIVSKGGCVTGSAFDAFNRPVVYLYALGEQGFYLGLYGKDLTKVYWTNDLADAFNFAAEAINLSE